MGVLRGLLVVGAIGLIAVAPCLVCLLLVSADEMFERVGRAFMRGARGLRKAVRRRAGGDPEWRDGPVRRWWHLSWAGRFVHKAAPAPEPEAPPIEQLAADLRRLNRLRVGVATRSPVWFNAVQRAYDGALRVACAQLGIDQYLDQVSGVDLEVERLRVEGELQRAGLALRDTKTGQR
ncbi:hypothetical protein [Dactylosporangium sp. NPDC005555]|uniref:hypothetical protein n=1 Tax=Dactylosporangium sp. NPDC005555 TaxID=3154889 RepID=UPI00339F73D4